MTFQNMVAVQNIIIFDTTALTLIGKFLWKNTIYYTETERVYNYF